MVISINLIRYSWYKIAINKWYNYCEFYFHSPCEVKIIHEGFELLDKDAVICKVEVSGGEIVINKVYRSLYYLKKEEINCVSVRCNMNNKKCSIEFDIRLIS